MEKHFIKADTYNLPQITGIMVAQYCSQNISYAEFCIRKASISPSETYGDDAVGYVQICRQGDLCKLKCQICTEYRVGSKSYSVTMVVDEGNQKITKAECHDCAGCSAGCKHVITFIMWAHRRSEEPDLRSVVCYWRKPKSSEVETPVTLQKIITAKEVGNGNYLTPVDYPASGSCFSKFINEAKKRKLSIPILKIYSDNVSKRKKNAAKKLLENNFVKKNC